MAQKNTGTKISELAKNFKLKNKEVIDILEENGVTGKTHTATLEKHEMNVFLESITKKNEASNEELAAFWNRKKPEPAQKLIKMAYGKYTQFCEMMESRAERYNKDAEKLEQLRASGKAFVFYPKKELLIHRTENDPAKLMRLYDHGYRHAQWAAESLQKYLSK